MHERSLVTSLLRQVEDLMLRSGADRAVEVNVSIGEFSGVDPNLFAIAFDDLVGQCAASGARLNVEVVPLEGKCCICERSFLIRHFKFRCAYCESREVTIVRGEALDLQSVVMEQGEA